VIKAERREILGTLDATKELALSRNGLTVKSFRARGASDDLQAAPITPIWPCLWQNDLTTFPTTSYEEVRLKNNVWTLL
jgi:hypothetical protein